MARVTPPTIYSVAIGNEIATRRRALGVTQGNLAALLGIKQFFLSTIEHGKLTRSADHWYRKADAVLRAIEGETEARLRDEAKGA